MDTSGTIFTKFSQLGFADDVDIIKRLIVSPSDWQYEPTVTTNQHNFKVVDGFVSHVPWIKSEFQPKMHVVQNISQNSSYIWLPSRGEWHARTNTYIWHSRGRPYVQFLDQNSWRWRFNHELAMIYQELCRFHKINRLKWIGHVQRINENRIPKKLLADRKPDGWMQLENFRNEKLWGRYVRL